MGSRPGPMACEHCSVIFFSVTTTYLPRLEALFSISVTRGDKMPLIQHFFWCPSTRPYLFLVQLNIGQFNLINIFTFLPCFVFPTTPSPWRLISKILHLFSFVERKTVCLWNFHLVCVCHPPPPCGPVYRISLHANIMLLDSILTYTFNFLWSVTTTWRIQTFLWRGSYSGDFYLKVLKLC